MIGWIIVAIMVIVIGTIMALRLIRNGQLQPRERKEENPPISRVTSRELMATLYKRRRVLQEELTGLRKRRDELVREIDQLSIEKGIDHHGISPEFAVKLDERARLHFRIVSVVGDIQRLDKYIEATQRVLSSKACRD